MDLYNKLLERKSSKEFFIYFCLIIDYKVNQNVWNWLHAIMCSYRKTILLCWNARICSFFSTLILLWFWCTEYFLIIFEWRCMDIFFKSRMHSNGCWSFYKQDTFKCQDNIIEGASVSRLLTRLSKIRKIFYSYPENTKYADRINKTKPKIPSIR